MRRIMILLSVLALGGTGPALADSMTCGLKPLAPLGCSSSNARCICEADGQCRWVFDC